MNSTDPSFLREIRQKRKVSSFIAEGLLYEFNLDFLDEERSQAVREALQKDPLLNQQLKRIESAEHFLQSLSRISVSSEAITRIKVHQSPFRKALKRIHLSKWPKGVIHSVELGITVLTLVAVFFLLPWKKILSNIGPNEKQYVLVELSGKEPNSATMEKDLAQFEDDSRIESIKSGLLKEQKETPLLDYLYKWDHRMVPSLGSKKEPLDSLRAKTPEGAKLTQNSSPQKRPLSPSMVQSSIDLSPEIGTGKAVPTKESGYLYRGFAQIGNIEANNKKLVEMLSQIGAQKAGRVNLGWRKEHGSYFHFTIPEANYSKVLEVFNGFGKLVIQKEKHVKSMPSGIIRIIIDAQDRASMETKASITSHSKDSSETRSTHRTLNEPPSSIENHEHE